MENGTTCVAGALVSCKVSDLFDYQMQTMLYHIYIYISVALPGIIMDENGPWFPGSPPTPVSHEETCMVCARHAGLKTEKGTPQNEPR